MPPKRFKKTTKSHDDTLIHTRNNDIFNYAYDNQGYKFYRIISIDPGTRNLAIRIEQRYENIVITEVLEKYDIKKGKSSCMYINLIELLTNFIDYMKNSHFILIERQVKMNEDMKKLAQHIVAFILNVIRFNTFMPFVLEISSKNKSIILPKVRDKDDKKFIKQLSIDKAFEILRARNDQNALIKIVSETKKDDLCDTIIQAEAFWLNHIFLLFE